MLQVTGLVIAPELAQRRLVQLEENLAQLLRCRIAGCEILSVNLSQRANERVSVFAADFTVLVAVAIVETCLGHAALHRARGRQHPSAGIKWQLMPAWEIALWTPWVLDGNDGGLVMPKQSRQKTLLEVVVGLWVRLGSDRSTSAGYRRRRHKTGEFCP